MDSQYSPPFVGRPTPRVDGHRKVTGSARYAAEYDAPGLLHGCIVSAAIAHGRIVSIDTSAALDLPGVIDVFTHLNRPARISNEPIDYMDSVGPPGKPFRPLLDDRILFSGQPVALVVADHFEAARDAAALVRVRYANRPHATDLEEEAAHAYRPPKKRLGIPDPPKPRGDFEAAFDASAVQLMADYHTPAEHHNPMEPFATTCIWRADDAGDGHLLIHDKTQGSQSVKDYIGSVFGLRDAKIRVQNTFVGGAFGSGLRPQQTVFLAVMAALVFERSVRVTLTRDQMFGLSHRPETRQTVLLGADRSGRLSAIGHHAVAGTSTFEDHQEQVVNWSTLLYHAEHTQQSHRLAALHTNTPSDMRAPGAVIGMFAIESAMDELAHRLRMDPIQLRLANHTDRDENTDKPFTSKSLQRCYERGAEAFGWAQRTFEPGSMRDEATGERIGWGMASGVWETMVYRTSARATLSADGRLTVASATSDIGTGSYTVMAQLGADAIGLPLDRVTALLGDSSLPKAPVEGGSWGAASTGSAVHLACEKLKKELVLATWKIDGRPLGRVLVGEVEFVQGRIRRRDDPSIGVSLQQAMAASGKQEISAKATANFDVLGMLRYRKYTHSAIFCEVRVDAAAGQRARHAARQRGRGRPHPEPADRTQPDHRRHGDGHRQRAARREHDGPRARPLHEPQLRRVPRAGERGRGGHAGDLRGRARRQGEPDRRQGPGRSRHRRHCCRDRECDLSCDGAAGAGAADHGGQSARTEGGSETIGS